MGVKVETPKKWRTELATAFVRGLKRHVNGQWSASVVVGLRIHLRDGRAIYGLHIVPIHCSQLGRKPVNGPVRKARPNK
jgi:hypothetical protein